MNNETPVEQKESGRWQLPALHWQIVIALILAAVAGALIGDQAGFIAAVDFIGKLFLNALKMMIIPLILAAMVSSMMSMNDQGSLGRLGLFTALFFVLTTTLSVLTGLVLVNWIAPGMIDGLPASQQLGLSAGTGEVLGKIESKGGGDILGVFLRMVPPNLIEAAAADQMLAIIFFGILFGYFASKLAGSQAQTQRQFWDGLYETMIAITGWVMLFAPIGVFALVSKTVALTGWDAVGPLLKFFWVVVLALAIQAFVWLPIILKLLARVSPKRHFKVAGKAMLTAFSTSSSVATIPVSMECMRRGGVSQKVSGFVLPLGSNLNMNGTALYECVAAMFIAQAYGLELSFVTQFVVVLLAVVTAIGVAGIPSASLVAIAVILGAIGLPLEGIGLILAVDRVLDMARTAINVFGDTVCTVLMARWQGEDGVLGEPAMRREPTV